MKKITVTENVKASMDDFYGIFFEDLNHAADGGLYAEKVRNRAFEFSPADNPRYQSLTAWKKIELGGASVAAKVSCGEPYSKKNPHYLTLEISKVGERAGIKNLGYNSGIAVAEGERYAFSCYARSNGECKLNVSIDDAYGNIICSDFITVSSDKWTKYTLTLTSGKTDNSASLAITSDEPCKVCLDFVSLMPYDTYKGRENGMRKDLAVMLEELKPRFMRFPGGCLVHDGSLNACDRNSMYRWKNTIGDITERPSRRNNWKYNQSLGIGYYEYFLFCEDIGAKPLPVLPAGYNPHMEQAAPLDEMDEWVNDALDLIEFANGGTDTKWGAVRAKLGHSEPFNLEYLGIGNEEVGEGFWERYDIIHKAVREKYPEIKLVNNAGPFPAGGEFERGWKNARENGSDLVDEHYYTSPEWLLANIHRYDDYPDDPKVFLGEYASWGNTFYNALCEAAYMTGLENNADKVKLVCYAPLFANVDYVDWKPVMIWFDNSRVYGSANYYLCKMFMTNTGRELTETLLSGFAAPTVKGDNAIRGGIEFAADEINGRVYDIKVTDLKSGKTEEFDGADFKGSGTKKITDITSDKYRVEFKIVRTFGNAGFKLYFGKKDDKNYIQWFIGGWANFDSEVNAVVNGRGSCLTHEMFSLQTGREYSLCLEVDGRGITTYIDGKKTNSTVDKLPAIEEIYATSSRDDKYVYVKAVNVLDKEVTAEVTIEGTDAVRGEVSTLTADLDAENGFDEPQKVSPVTENINRNSNTFEYTFPPHSVTVFKAER